MQGSLLSLLFTRVGVFFLLPCFIYIFLTILRVLFASFGRVELISSFVSVGAPFPNKNSPSITFFFHVFSLIFSVSPCFFPLVYFFTFSFCPSFLLALALSDLIRLIDFEFAQFRTTSLFFFSQLFFSCISVFFLASYSDLFYTVSPLFLLLAVFPTLPAYLLSIVLNRFFPKPYFHFACCYFCNFIPPFTCLLKHPINFHRFESLCTNPISVLLITAAVFTFHNKLVTQTFDTGHVGLRTILYPILLCHTTENGVII